MKQITMWGAIAATLALVLSGCGEKASSSSSSDKVLKIAEVLPVTGSSASTYGKSFRAGAEYVFDTTNEAGGVTCTDGTKKKIEYKTFDDQMSPDVSQTAARKALDAGYQLILGPLGSAVATAVQPIMAQSKAMWVISPASVDGPAKLPNVFQTAPPASAAEDAAVKFVSEHPEFKRIGLITDQNHPGNMAAQPALLSHIEKLGSKVVAIEKFSTGDKDFRASLSRLKSQDISLLLVRSYPTEAALILNQAAELGTKFAININVGFTTQEARSLINKDALSAPPILMQNVPIFSLDVPLAAGNAVAKAVADKEGSDVGTFTAAGHDAAVMIVKALEATCSVDPAKTVPAMEALKVSDLQGQLIATNKPFAGDLLLGPKGDALQHRVNQEAAIEIWDKTKGWAAE